MLDLFDKINVRYEINKKTLIVYKSNNINGIKIKFCAYKSAKIQNIVPYFVIIYDTFKNNEI